MFVRLNIGLLPSDAVKYPQPLSPGDRLRQAVAYCLDTLTGVIRIEVREGPHEPFLAVDGTAMQSLSMLRAQIIAMAQALDQDCIAAEITFPEIGPDLKVNTEVQQLLLGPRPGPWEPFRPDLFYRIP